MKKVISVLLVLMMLSSLFTMPVSAATQESVVINLEKQRSIVMWVSWDKEKPTVVFVAPDGKIFDPKTSSSDTSIIEKDTEFFYVIKNAAKGEWRARVDKGNNTKVNISVHNYSQGISIDYFDIGTIEGDRLPIKFKVSGEDGQTFKYKISAMVDHNGVEKELSSGSTSVGNEYSGSVRLFSLSTYDAYLLKLYVWYVDDGADVSDFMFSKTFSYTNTGADSKVYDFSLTIVPDSQQLLIEWKDLGWSADNVLIAVFENGAKEPNTFDEYKASESSVQLAYDPAATEVAVEFTVKYDGVNSAPVRKTASLGQKMAVSIPDGELFNTLQLPMTYKGLSKQSAKVTVNDKSNELVLDGDGKVNISLVEDWNDVQVTYLDKNGINWRIEREIYVDRKPPVLTMNRPYDGMVLEQKSIAISGIAVDSSSVTVNGTAVTVDEQNAFSTTVELKQGANTINVIAKDGAGNQSQYTATITRGVAEGETVVGGSDTASENPAKWYDKLLGKGSYWVLIITSVLCLGVIGYAFVFWRKIKNSDEKRADKENKKASKTKKNGNTDQNI